MRAGSARDSFRLDFAAVGGSDCPITDREVREMKVAGALIFVVGLFLFLGNIIGFFPTFPGVGYLTMAVGGILYKKAN